MSHSTCVERCCLQPVLKGSLQLLMYGYYTDTNRSVTELRKFFIKFASRFHQTKVKILVNSFNLHSIAVFIPILSLSFVVANVLNRSTLSYNPIRPARGWGSQARMTRFIAASRNLLFYDAKTFLLLGFTLKTCSNKILAKLVYQGVAAARFSLRRLRNFEN